MQDHLGNTRVVYQPLFCGVENASGEPIEYDVEYVGDYFPYAKTIREYVKGKKEKFLTTYHERDEETGLDYRGARFYDADIGRFLSLDPLAADYPSLSDYNYVAGNPIILIDPTGKSIDDVRITGSQADKAFEELQASVSDELNLSMGEDGKVSYSRKSKESLSDDATQLVNAIDDNSIFVNVKAENKNITSTNEFYVGGAFMGNEVVQHSIVNIVFASQEINPQVLADIDDYFGTSGSLTLHEVTEAYQGALITQKSGVSGMRATKAEINNPNSVYRKAHEAATPQEHSYIQRVYDKNGKIVGPSGTAAKAVISVQEGNRPEKIILTFPEN